VFAHASYCYMLYVGLTLVLGSSKGHMKDREHPAINTVLLFAEENETAYERGTRGVLELIELKEPKLIPS
jgi:hypothetical protein